jgi:hypothetical protein
MRQQARTESRMMRTPATVLFCMLGIVLARPGQAADDSETQDAIRAVTGRLVLGQLASGPLEGAWPEEEAYTGSVVVGLVNAYTVTGDEDARVAAVSGGNFILRVAAGNYYGDEAYALMCLSQMSEDGSPNMWRLALEEFYRNVSHRSQGGTPGYISQFEEADPSVAAFYLAHHTVAAFYVEAEDREVWREALVDYLSRVDDFAEGPVMALGIATWALAETGSLDDSLVNPDAPETSYWYARTLAGLPELLLSHRIDEGELAGSFYWRFDHGAADMGGPPGGYTEELVSSALGLAGVGDLADQSEIALASREIQDLLIQTIGVDGSVRQHLTLGGEAYYSEAAGVLRALAHLITAAEVTIDEDDLVDAPTSSSSP